MYAQRLLNIPSTAPPDPPRPTTPAQSFPSSKQRRRPPGPYMPHHTRAVSPPAQPRRFWFLKSKRGKHHREHRCHQRKRGAEGEPLRAGKTFLPPACCSAIPFIASLGRTLVAIVAASIVSRVSPVGDEDDGLERRSSGEWLQHRRINKRIQVKPPDCP